MNRRNTRTGVRAVDCNVYTVNYNQRLGCMGFPKANSL